MRAVPLRLVLAPLLLALLPAQERTVLRCGHVLAEDAASWRQDLVLVLDRGGIVELRAPVAGERIDRDLAGAFVIPGLIDLHTHLLLRPYDQIGWDDQVLKESLELRAIRATRHAADTLLAGFVAVRELGTEGAGFADVALRAAIAEGSVLGPRIVPSTRALVATGCYGPNLAGADVAKGAQVADGEDGVRRAVREQVAAGAQWIKVYADYRRAAGAAATPTFSAAELAAICDEAKSAGVPVAAHASTDEGIRRAVLAGVRTIEHGGGASAETLGLLRERGVVLCPCLAANEAIVRYAGHRGPVVERLSAGKVGFQRALAAGVVIACGSDAGVFAHGDNARELELMVDYGMTSSAALASATVVAAKVLGRTELGVLAAGRDPGVVVLDGDPLHDISALRRVRQVWVGGRDVRALPLVR